MPESFPRLLDQSLEDIGRRVALDLEPHGELLIPVGDLGVETEDALQVD